MSSAPPPSTRPATRSSSRNEVDSPTSMVEIKRQQPRRVVARNLEDEIVDDDSSRDIINSDDESNNNASSAKSEQNGNNKKRKSSMQEQAPSTPTTPNGKKRATTQRSGQKSDSGSSSSTATTSDRRSTLRSKTGTTTRTSNSNKKSSSVAEAQDENSNNARRTRSSSRLEQQKKKKKKQIQNTKRQQDSAYEDDSEADESSDTEEYTNNNTSSGSEGESGSDTSKDSASSKKRKKPQPKRKQTTAKKPRTTRSTSANSKKRPRKKSDISSGDEATEKEQSDSEESTDYDSSDDELIIFTEDFVIEKILAADWFTNQGSNNNNSKVQKFLVKFRNKSYRHVKWLTEQEVAKAHPQGRQMVSRFISKQHSMADNVWNNKGEGGEEEEIEEDDCYFDPEYNEVDRILDSKQVSTGKKYYLVKWKSLPYTEATWEDEETLKNDTDKIEQYQRINIPPTATSHKPKPFPKKFNKEMPEPEFKGGNHLRDYQLEGFRWLVCQTYGNRNSILADEMGLGKTIQSISLLYHLNKEHNMRGPFLVIAPLSTIGNWQREFETWTDMNCIVYHGSDEARSLIREYEWHFKKAGKIIQPSLYKFEVVITTYEMIIADMRSLNRINWQYLVIDEAHRIKNTFSKLLQALKTFKSERRLLLTGTPMQNGMGEMWTMLNFIDPQKFKSSQEFLRKFGDLKEASQLNELHEELSPYLLRRMKEDVETKLPPKEETIVELELTSFQKKYYRALLEKNRDFLERGISSKSNRPHLINIMMEIRKCCNHPYLVAGAEESVMNTMDDPDEINEHMIKCCSKLMFLDKLLKRLREQGKKVLIFSQMVRMLHLLEDFLDHRGYAYEKLDGTVKSSDRQASIDRFCNPKSNRFVFLLSTRAGGLGINLTAADTVIIYDSDWNPQNDLQAQARAHRIGQEKNVKIYRLITRATYEEYMFNVASKKLGISSAVLGNKADAGEEKDKSSDASTYFEKKTGLDINEINNMLKYGAYHMFKEEDEKAKEQDQVMLNEDIDQILEKSSRLVTFEGNGEDSKGMINKSLSTFSKARFFTEKTDTEVDIEDENFWEKVLPEFISPTRLMSNLQDGTVESSKECKDKFWADLTSCYNDVKNELDTSNDHSSSRLRDLYKLLMLVQGPKYKKIFTLEEQQKATEWAASLEKPRLRRRAATSYRETRQNRKAADTPGAPDEADDDSDSDFEIPSDDTVSSTSTIITTAPGSSSATAQQQQQAPTPAAQKDPKVMQTQRLRNMVQKLTNISKWKKSYKERVKAGLMTYGYGRWTPILESAKLDKKFTEAELESYSECFIQQLEKQIAAIPAAATAATSSAATEGDEAAEGGGENNPDSSEVLTGSKPDTPQTPARHENLFTIILDDTVTRTASTLQNLIQESGVSINEPEKAQSTLKDRALLDTQGIVNVAIEPLVLSVNKNIYPSDSIIINIKIDINNTVASNDNNSQPTIISVEKVFLVLEYLGEDCADINAAARASKGDISMLAKPDIATELALLRSHNDTAPSFYEKKYILCHVAELPQQAQPSLDGGKAAPVNLSVQVPVAGFVGDYCIKAFSVVQCSQHQHKQVLVSGSIVNDNSEATRATPTASASESDVDSAVDTATANSDHGDTSAKVPANTYKLTCHPFLVPSEFEVAPHQQHLKNPNVRIQKRLLLLWHLRALVEEYGQGLERLSSPMRKGLIHGLHLTRRKGGAYVKWWWDETIHDRALLVGVYKHGFGKYDAIFQDKELQMRPKDIQALYEERQREKAEIAAAVANEDAGSGQSPEEQEKDYSQPSTPFLTQRFEKVVRILNEYRERKKFLKLTKQLQQQQQQQQPQHEQSAASDVLSLDNVKPKKEKVTPSPKKQKVKASSSSSSSSSAGAGTSTNTPLWLDMHGRPLPQVYDTRTPTPPHPNAGGNGSNNNNNKGAKLPVFFSTLPPPQGVPPNFPPMPMPLQRQHQHKQQPQPQPQPPLPASSNYGPAPYYPHGGSSSTAMGVGGSGSIVSNNNNNNNILASPPRHQRPHLVQPAVDAGSITIWLRMDNESLDHIIRPPQARSPFFLPSFYVTHRLDEPLLPAMNECKQRITRVTNSDILPGDGDIVFKYNGREVAPTDTPKSLNMRNSDTIDVCARNKYIRVILHCVTPSNANNNNNNNSSSSSSNNPPPAYLGILDGIPDDTFTVCTTRPLHNLMETFFILHELSPRMVRFEFNQRKLHKDDTADEVGLYDNCVIEVHPQDPNVIELNVHGVQLNAEVMCKIRRTTPLRKLMEVVCKYFAIKRDLRDINFCFAGRRLEPTQTPSDVGLEDGDRLTVNWIEQIVIDDDDDE